MNRLIELVTRMPRAGRWLLVFVAFIAIYLLAIEPALDAASVARARADSLESDLRRERLLLAPSSRAGGELERAVSTFGLPRHPADAGARPEALQRTVNAILLDHGVENAAYSERSGAIRADEAGAVVGATARLDRYVLDVAFEAAPGTVMAILADLEQDREVTAVSRVKIDKAVGGGGRSRDSSDDAPPAPPARTVRVMIAVESWIAAPALNPVGGRS